MGVGTVGRREIRFGGSAVSVEYEGEAAAWVVDFLYRYSAPADKFLPHLTYRVIEKEGRLDIYCGDALLCAGVSKGAAADWLMGDSCHRLAERSRDGLLFHAAALARPECGLILPGTIGAGKSTLTAWLTARGWAYLTDEMVYIPSGDDCFAAFTRPLNLKTPSLEPLAELLDFERPCEYVLSTPQGMLLSPALLNAAPSAKTPLAGVLLIFPRYVPGGEMELRPLSPAQTGLALMECLVNARNLPDHGFAEVARLARCSPGYALRYGHFEQIGGQIDALHG